MKKTFVLAALSLALAAPVQAQGTAPSAAPAPATGATPDLRCMVVMMNLSQSPEQRQQMEALVGSFYFLGRIDTQDAKIDLEKRIIAEMDGMTDAQFAAEAQRCDGAMRARMRTLSEMADDLSKKAEESNPTPPGNAPPPAGPPPGK